MAVVVLPLVVAFFNGSGTIQKIVRFFLCFVAWCVRVVVAVCVYVFASTVMSAVVSSHSRNAEDANVWHFSESHKAHTPAGCALVYPTPPPSLLIGMKRNKQTVAESYLIKPVKSHNMKFSKA
jgi:hypothetical protein